MEPKAELLGNSTEAVETWDMVEIEVSIVRRRKGTMFWLLLFSIEKRTCSRQNT